ncbi:22508_t:CDS:2, partial [Entrophospora sp. SA101]
ENGNIINVPGTNRSSQTNKSSRNSVIFKDEDGNMTNPDDDVNPEVVRRSISIVADENGNIINTPGTNRSSPIVKDENGNIINVPGTNRSSRS